MFSRRSTLNREPNELALAALDGKKPHLDLTCSNPTQADLLWDPSVLCDALTTGELHVYDPQPFGLESARQAVASQWASLGLSVGVQQVVLTSSTSEGYAFAFKLLCDPGDEVLVPSPSYPLLEHLARFEGVRLLPYPLSYDGAWHIDLSALRAQRSTRTKAVVVVSPNNPTGSCLRLDELEALEHEGLPLISDEVFASYTWEAPAPVATLLQARGVLVLTLQGLSKLALLPQVKLAWLTVGGPASLRTEALGRLELIADAYLSPSISAQVALPTFLEHHHSIQKRALARIRGNLETVRGALEGSAATLLHAEAGWYVVIQLPATQSEAQWWAELRSHGVLVQPGWLYDFPMTPLVVLSLLTPSAELRHGVELLRRLVDAV